MPKQTKEFRAIVAHNEINRLTKAKDYVKGGAGQFDLGNFENRLNEFAKDGWDLRFTNATTDGEGRIIIYAVLEREVKPMDISVAIAKNKNR